MERRNNAKNRDRGGKRTSPTHRYTYIHSNNLRFVVGKLEAIVASDDNNGMTEQ
jgi:hypothetical protein